MEQSATELREAEDQRIKLEAEYERLTKEIEFLRGKIDKENKEKGEVQQASVGLEGQLQELQQKFDALQIEYEELKKHLSTIQAAAGKAADMSALESQKIELDRRSKDHTRLMQRLQQRDVEYEDLRAQIERLKKEQETIRKEANQEKKQMQDGYQQELSRKEEEFHKIRIALESELTQYREKNDVLESKLKQFQDSLGTWGQVEKQNLAYKQQLADAQKSQTELEEQRKLLEKEANELKTRIEQYRHVNMNPQGEFDAGVLLPGSDGEYYIIQKMLGRGGMGIAYSAMRGSDEKIVVIKTLLPENTNDLKVVMRFVQEARIILSFDHDNLVKGYDLQQGKTLTYFVMEFLDGPSVEEILEEQAFMDPVHATEIILGMAKALEYLESHHLVHRDVKPSNIILTKAGIPKMVDFGIVKMTDRSYSLTTEGIILGTPYYLSPEQTYQTKVDIRSDIYNLGATYYHMVVGEVPFPGDNPIDVIQKRLVKAPEPEKVKPDLPKPVAAIIKKMMNKNIKKRHNQTSELVAELQDTLERIRK